MQTTGVCVAIASLDTNASVVSKEALETYQFDGFEEFTHTPAGLGCCSEPLTAACEGCVDIMYGGFMRIPAWWGPCSGSTVPTSGTMGM